MNNQKKWLRYYLQSFIDDNLQTLEQDQGVNLPIKELKKGWLSNQTMKLLKEKETMLDEDVEYIICLNPYISKSEEKTKEKTKFITPLLIPAKIVNDKLLPVANRPPYIHRSYLEPLHEDSSLSIGSLKKQTSFSDKEPYPENDSWSNVLTYAEKLFQHVTDKNLSNFTIENYTKKKTAWIAPLTALSIHDSIPNLYQDLIYRDKLPDLLQNFLSIKKQKRKLLQSSIAYADQHVGQMKGDKILNQGQRESLQHFLSSYKEEGNILAINGPPGTGKTYLLQNIVATLWVQSALKGKEPPIIVASSANNQALQNLMNSFDLDTQKNNPKFILQTRWIPDLKGFTLYYASKRMKKKLIDQNHPYQLVDFMRGLDKKENLPKTKKYFMDKCNKYAKHTFLTINEACQFLHQQLLKTHQKFLEGIRICLEHEKNNKILKSNYGSSLKQIETYYQKTLDEKNNKQTLCNETAQLISIWQDHFKPKWLYKIFSLFPSIRKKTDQNAVQFLVDLPVDIPIDRTAKTFKEIDQLLNEYYSLNQQELQIATQKHFEIHQHLKQRDQLINQWNNWQKQNLSIQTEVDKYTETIQLVSQLDQTLRYKLFLIATHYWEARWLIDKENKVPSGSLEENRKKLYHRFAKLTPCFVFTLHSLPFWMLTTQTDDKTSKVPGKNFLYGFIDLLIMDEAGQTTPHLAAPSLSLTKNALIVGDVLQLKPVTNITQSIDIGNLSNTHVAKGSQKIRNLEELGMLASSGNAMKIAQQRSCYQKIDLFGGMFLHEHLRSVDPIITFNNEEVYGGQLTPLRGKENKYPFLYQMGYVDIEGEARKSGSSKINIVEADAIVQWLIKNKERIVEHANQKTKKRYELKDLVAILTPFKHQATLIRMCLRRAKINDIVVGTVHTMQGAEKEVILFSAVDTSHDYKAFYDRSINMLNVTVSRAEESFLIFTNWRRFGKIPNTPSSLLRKHIPDEHCQQKSYEYEKSKFINEIINREIPAKNSEEQAIINHIIINDNKGQVVVASEKSNVTATYNQTNQSSSKPTK